MDNGGHLCRGSLACNGETLIWFARHWFHVFDVETGVRRRKDNVSSTGMISCYDAKENWYYYMDAACYSWLKKFHVSGFTPRVIKKEAKELPDLPIVFDQPKSEILAQIKAAEEKANEERKNGENEEAKKPKKDDKPRNDLFELISKQDEEALYNWTPETDLEEKKAY